jgi:hypothetical protein
MAENDRDLARLLQEQERARIKDWVPLPPREPLTIPYTDLPEAIPGSPIAVEWEFYRRIVGRLLEEGNEGKWLLAKGEEIVGIWNTYDEVNRVRLERFLAQPALMKQILSREPVLRVGGHLRRWHS